MNPIPEFTFPCRAVNKAPCRAGWQRELFQNVEWKGAELVGAHTGETNGFDVLDVDGDAGRAWYDANFDALPTTHAQETRRGVHLYFRAAPGLHCSVGKATSGIAPGIDVRAEGGFVILWGREGFPFEEHPICEWPNWLLAEAMAACGPRGKESGPPRQGKTLREEGVGVAVAGAGDALRQMDPRDWGGDFDGWWALAGACKAVGIPRDEFADWSIGDPEYADRRGEIERIFDCAQGAHGGALYSALAKRGINLPGELSAKRSLSGGSTSVRGSPTINLRRRTDALRAWLAAEPTDDHLFRVAATFGEIILEKRLTRWVANELLEEACKENGLWKLLGADRCRRTIANGFRHVEEKFLGEVDRYEVELAGNR
jgi:Bifunctional DNA primase/polymerase, N-terminal